MENNLLEKKGVAQFLRRQVLAKYKKAQNEYLASKVFFEQIPGGIITCLFC